MGDYVGLILFFQYYSFNKCYLLIFFLICTRKAAGLSLHRIDSYATRRRKRDPEVGGGGGELKQN